MKEQEQYDFSNEKEIDIIKDLLNKDSSITIDIGANTGIFTKVLAENSKFVYALEPDPDNFRQLKRNLKPYDNVSLYDYAASDKTGIGTLYRSHINNGMHRLYASRLCDINDTVTVRTARIDDLIIQREGERKIDFIKMDVEGYEFYVIVGMINLLRRDKPVIISEFHPASIKESGADPELVYRIMRDIYHYDPPIHCITGEFLDTYEKLEKETSDPKGGVNILWRTKK